MGQRELTVGRAARGWRGLAAALLALSLLVALLGVTARPAGAVASQAVASQTFGWGYNGFLQVSASGVNAMYPVPINGTTGFTGIKSVAAGQTYSLAVKNDGTVWSWGSDYSGQLGRGSFGGSASAPTPVVTTPGGAQLGGVERVSAGNEHALALKSGALPADRTVWAWGNNDNGQLGDGTTVNSNVPVQVLTAAAVPLTNVIAISAGQYHSLALTATGAVYAWGSNGYGVNWARTRAFSPVALTRFSCQVSRGSAPRPERLSRPARRIT